MVGRIDNPTYTKSMKKKALLITILIFIFVPFAAAQDEPLVVEVSKDEMTTDETVQLRITIYDANASEPVLPNLGDFLVLGSSRSSQTTIINGDMSSQISYEYTLRPVVAGELTIDSVQVVIGGQAVASTPITIQVEMGTQPIAPDMDPSLAMLSENDFWMEAAVDNTNPYVGEQIVYTVRAFLRSGVRLNVPYDLPEFEGFWRQGTSQTDNTQILENENGRYHMFEFQTIAFPMLAGEQVIEETKLGIEEALELDNLHTDSIAVQVRPLPDNAPESFNGAVGEFEILSVVDTQEVAVDEPIVMRVAVRGLGNVDTLPEPNWPETEGWRQFEGNGSIQTDVNNGRFIGQRLYERVLIPSAGGEYILPPIEYTFFNPQTEQYETVSTDPIPVTVTGNIGAAAISSTDDSTESGQSSNPDLRPILAAPAKLSDYQSPITESWYYWAFWTLPLIALVLNGFWQRRQSGTIGSMVAPSTVAEQALALLANVSANGSEGFTAVHQAIHHYLTHKLGSPTIEMPSADLEQFLTDKNIAIGFKEKALELLAWSEMGRYSPLGSESETAVDEAKWLIKNLEEELR